MAYKKRTSWMVKITRPGQIPIVRTLGKIKDLTKRQVKDLEAEVRSEVRGMLFDIQIGRHLKVSGLLKIYEDRHSKKHKS